MNVRQAQPTDFAPLRPMLIDMGFVEDPNALEQRFPLFCDSPDHHFIVAEENGILLGYALVHDYGEDLRSGVTHRTAKLEDLYVLPASRRQGVARQLMRSIESWARNRPLRYVFWYANQSEAGQAYQRMGYAPTPSGQEGFDFYEIDLGNPLERLPHPYRGS